MLKIRRSRYRFILNMGISFPRKTVFILRRGSGLNIQASEFENHNSHREAVAITVRILLANTVSMRANFVILFWLYLQFLVEPCIFVFFNVASWWHHQMEPFPRYWSFVWGIHRSPVNSTHKGQWRGALMFSLICAWINGWVNNGAAGDLRRHRAHYDVTIMSHAHERSHALYTYSICTVACTCEYNVTESISVYQKQIG